MTTQLEECGMTVYVIPLASGRQCGERTVFEDNAYTRAYPGR